MADKESNVVLNFKMDGQVEYAKTIRDINAIMNAAASEYKTHVAAMGKDADETKKLSVEKKKLEIQLEAGQERTKKLRAEYELMAKDTKTSTGQLANKYKQLQNSERAEIALSDALDKVNDGLTDQAEESRKAQDALNKLEGEAEGLESQTEKLNAEYELQKAQLGDNATESEQLSLKMEHLNNTHEVAGEKVKNYEQQLDEAKAAYGENSEEVDKYEIQLLEARTAEQELANEIKETNQKIKDQGGVFDDVAGKVESFGGKATDAGKKMSLWVTGPLFAGVGGLIALSKATGDAADRILDLNEITGLSTDSIQEWRHVSTVAGVEQEALTNAVEGLVRKIPQLESEGGKATEQLEKLGLSFSDLKTMTPDEQLDTLMAKMAEMEDPLERNAVGAQLFGGSWKDIAPVLGMSADEIANTREEAHELGLVLSEEALNDANDFRVEMDTLMQTLQGVFLQIGADLVPLLQETLVPLIQEQVIPAIQIFAEKVQEVIEWFTNLSPEMQNNILMIMGLVAAIGPLLIVFGSMAGGLGKIIGLIPKLLTLVTGLGKALMFLTTNPIGLAVVAIAGLIAIGVALYKNWDTVSSKAKEIWGNIKSTISDTIGGAKDAVSNAIDTIKGLFDFKFKWPKLKMPKFSIEGSMNPVKWINEGVPKLSVKWNAKGGIFTQPTIFGASGGQLQGAGEAGPEAVLPLNEKTLGDIGRGIAAEMGGNGNVVVHVYLDTDEVNSKLAPGMSKQLNDRNKINARGQGVVIV